MKDDNAATKAVMDTLTRGVRNNKKSDIRSRGRFGKDGEPLDDEEAALLRSRDGKYIYGVYVDCVGVYIVYNE